MSAQETAVPISTYYGVLRRAHELLAPEVYLEIGVHEGHSLAFVGDQTTAVGVDPEPKVSNPPANATIVAATSDDFFARPDLADVLGGAIDMAFVDGLHHFDQTLRDVANVERHASPDGVILIHDCNPIDAETSARERSTVVWSGDVWKVVVGLRRHRPDLAVHTVDADPTGLAVVTGLDPTSTVLFDRFDEIVSELDALTYAELEADREGLLNIVASDWNLIAPLLRS